MTASTRDRRPHDRSHAKRRPRTTERGASSGPVGNRDSATEIFGLHAAQFALANPARTIKAIRVTLNAERRLGDALAAHGALITHVSPQDLDRHLGTDTVHQGILLEVEPITTFDLDDLAEQCHVTGLPVVILDQVTDPQNVGAILRSCAMFGATGLVMTQRHSPPLGGALAKAASGALELTSVALVQNLAKAIDHLRTSGIEVVGLDGGEEHGLIDYVFAANAHRPSAIVLGAEGKGLRELTRQSCTVLARIGGGGPIASLNVSNAAAIALHLAAMGRRSAG